MPELKVKKSLQPIPSNASPSQCTSMSKIISDDSHNVLRHLNSSSTRIIGFFFNSVLKLNSLISCCFTYKSFSILILSSV